MANNFSTLKATFLVVFSMIEYVCVRHAWLVFNPNYRTFMPTFQQPAVPGNPVVSAIPEVMTPREVMTTFRMSRAVLIAAVKAGTLPQPIRLTPRVSVFRRSDIISRLA